MVKNHEAMKLGNQLIILRAIREQGPVTRVDLQKMTNLGWGTVTTSVNDFLQKGIISEIGSIQTGVGRRPISLDLNTSRNYVVGLRIGRTKTRSLLMDVKGKVIGEVERPVEGPDVEKLIRSFFDVIDQVLEDNAIGTDRLAASGSPPSAR
jgi:predicted transcriptional regulator